MTAAFTQTTSSVLPEAMKRVSVIDSHTGGEPTRVVLSGGPELRGDTLAQMRNDFSDRHDSFRSAIINEPRGSEVVVGALICDSPNLQCVAGVIFFNNVGVLGMCGHGMIGVVKTLEYLGRISPGTHCIDTPVGVVGIKLHDDGRVSVTNVASFRKATDVEISVADIGTIHGDVAWGGNWFFLVDTDDGFLATASLAELTDYASKIRRAVNEQGYPEVDHIELMGPAVDAENHGRNFVLCPGLAFDRSPCGTGTSAKVACLAENKQLHPGEIWRQESIIGSVFEASYEVIQGVLLPTITGRAWICCEAELVFDPSDPFRNGIMLPGQR